MVHRDMSSDVLARQSARNARTPEQQLAVLDRKLGKGQGAGKERAKLAKQIEDIRAAKKQKKEEKKQDAVKTES